MAHAELTGPEDLRPQHLRDYMNACLVARHSVSYINNDLRTLHGFLAFLQEEGYAVPQAVFHLPCLPQPETLPRFFTDEQIRQLRAYFERRVAKAQGPGLLRDALLDRAAFYLMWQSGLRRGEVEDLLREDLDLPSRRLTVRQGKSQKDRTVYLTAVTVQALEAYLAQRGLGPTDHVFLYRNAALSKDLIHSRLRAAGETLGFKVFAHRLRHTCATQLLNAGCQVTSIQKLLGHERLNSTMRYARVHNQTVATDYYTAMAQIERRLDLGPVGDKPLDTGERLQVLEITEQLSVPDLANDLRLALAAQMLQILARRGLDTRDVRDLPANTVALDLRAASP